MIRVMVCCLFLTECANAPTEEPYWFRDSDPIEVKHILYVDNVPCGEIVAWGCSMRSLGIILIAKRLPPWVQNCVLSHEKRHFAGWDHDRKPRATLDCGDGRILTNLAI